MELSTKRHALRAPSWWMARWAVKCQTVTNMMFVLFREGWCDDSGMQVSRWCVYCKSSQPACSLFCDEPAASGAGAAADLHLRGTASVLAEHISVLQCPEWNSFEKILFEQIRMFLTQRRIIMLFRMYLSLFCLGCHWMVFDIEFVYSKPGIYYHMQRSKQQCHNLQIKLVCKAVNALKHALKHR